MSLYIFVVSAILREAIDCYVKWLEEHNLNY